MYFQLSKYGIRKTISGFTHLEDFEQSKDLNSGLAWLFRIVGRGHVFASSPHPLEQIDDTVQIGYK